jgi:hypothetical protein
MRNCRIKYKRLIPYTLILLVAFAMMPLMAFAADAGTTQLQIPSGANYTITNEEGKILHYNGIGNISGDMRVINTDIIPIEPSPEAYLTVDKSSSFTIVNHEKGVTYIYIPNKEYFISVEAKGEDCIKLSLEGGERTATVTGNNAAFTVDLVMDPIVTVSGYTTSSCAISETGKGVRIQGISGQFSIDVADVNTSNERSFDLFSLGGVVNFNELSGKTIRVAGAIKLYPKEYSRVSVLHVCKMADPNKLLLYWGKVKRAKGYIIYKYDSGSGKYKKIARTEGKENRAWVDISVAAGKTYHYKVASYTKKTDINRASRMSYTVSGVTQHTKYENVHKISLSKTVLKGKAGKSAKLTATLTTVKGKKVISKSVRWYSMNKKVATVGKTGNVVFKKKGVCYIYAKAHDGMNSIKVRVTVS